MKSPYLRTVAAAVFLALAAYCAAEFSEGTQAPETLAAARVTVSETVHAEGIIYRDEEYVVCPFENAYIAVSEGERVQGGSIVCVSEGSLEAYLRFLDAHGGEKPSEMRGCVTAPCAGFFSTCLDGYESAEVTDGDGFSPEIPENAVGRIVANGWFFVADLSDAHSLHEGQKITLTIVDDYPAQVTRIDGNRVTLRVKQGLYSVLCTRFAEATLHITDASGIKIPRGCLHSDADGDFVYILKAGIKEKTPVTIIYENGSYSLAAEDKLHAGMLICK